MVYPTACDNCGQALPRISYGYPITHPKGQVAEWERRPPLCKPCWTRIVEEY